MGQPESLCVALFRLARFSSVSAVWFVLPRGLGISKNTAESPEDMIIYSI